MKPEKSKLPLRTVLLYLIFGSLWILLSDGILFILVPVTREIVFLQTLKGWFFILTSGAFLYIILIRELRARRQAEDALRLSEQLMSGIVDSAMDGIISIDSQQSIILVNPAASNMFGYKEDELLGQPLDGLIPHAYRERHREHVKRFVKTASTRRTREMLGEIYCLRADGTEFPVEASLSHTEVDGQKVSTVILRDITIRQRAEEELRTLNDKLEQRVVQRTEQLNHTNAELERANRTKDEFLANMSHELRTPLNSILGLSETLLEQRRGPLNEKQSQAIEMITNSGQHLLSLINDILEVSKIEAGKLQLHPDMISVKEVCESSMNFVREAALKKSITLELNRDASALALKADPQRLKQILVNLLSNAVKFTPEKGNVRLEVSLNQQRDQIQFAVSDNGIGIALDDLPKLFVPFTQLDSSLSRQYAGTGLGLVLVLKYTELHGGSVHVESEPGKGSRFTVHLPFDPNVAVPKAKSVPGDPDPSETDSQKEMPHTEFPSPRKTILIAEDNESNILVVREYLESRGYLIFVAQNGLQAIDKAEELSPDLILMDIQMPVMNGLEAIARLRADPRFASTPIIALTALAMPGDRERCLQVGATEYMSKPVSLKELVSTVNTLLRAG